MVPLDQERFFFQCLERKEAEAHWSLGCDTKLWSGLRVPAGKDSLEK